MLIKEQLLRQIEEKKKTLDKNRPLPPAVLQNLRDLILLEWTYHSNAIEGSTLTLLETKLILDEGLTIGGKSLREHLEVRNHAEAIDFIEALVEKEAPLNTQTIRQVHRIVLKGIDDKNAGRYRTIQVRIAGTDHLPPDPFEVPRLMKDYKNWLFYGEKELRPVEFAALAHFKLVNIHPFVDGNGRTARLLMNLILMRKGYPPAIIRKEERKSYYHALEEADVGKPKAFVNLVALAANQSLNLYLEALERATSPEYKRLTLTEASKFTPYSSDYLRLLARKGRLKAFKIGHRWYTNKKAIDEYLKLVGRLS